MFPPDYRPWRRYVPDDSTRQIDQDLQNQNRALIYNGLHNHY